MALTSFNAVTPNDSTDVANAGTWTRLILGTGGTVRFTSALGDVVNMTLPAGIHEIAVRRVHATGTSATGILVAA